MQVETTFISDVLRGHDTTEMRVSLTRYIEDEMPQDDEGNFEISLSILLKRRFVLLVVV